MTQFSRKQSRQPWCLKGMHSAQDYRRQAVHARQLADMTYQPELEDMLRRTAQNFEEMAEDIEAGAAEIRHPELLPKRP
jgi:hypothetical protein